jgi:hypothetical protein
VQRQQFAQFHARRVQQIRIEVQSDARVGQLRHGPQHTVAGELIDHRAFPCLRGSGAQRLCYVHQPAAVGVTRGVGVGQPEDVVGAAAGHVGAQRVEVARVGDDVDPYLNVGVLTGERGERLPIRRRDLFVPQPHRDHGPTAGFVGSAQQHRDNEQDSQRERQSAEDERGNTWAETHFSPVTTIERTMWRPNVTNNTISGTIATVVAAITSVHCAL